MSPGRKVGRTRARWAQLAEQSHLAGLATALKSVQPQTLAFQSWLGRMRPARGLFGWLMTVLTILEARPYELIQPLGR